LFAQGTGGSLSIVNTDSTGLTFNPLTATLTVGSLTFGDATTQATAANTIPVNTFAQAAFSSANAGVTLAAAAYNQANNAGSTTSGVQTNASWFPTFVDANNATTTSETLRTHANLNFNPSTGTLSITALSANTIASNSRYTRSTSAGINSSSARFALTTAQQADYHIASSVNGAGPTNTQQYGITFSPSGGLTQAGILISENGTDGTAIGFFCTNNYGSGPQLRSFIDPSGHYLPGVTASFDLGSTSLRWRNVFTSDLHLNNGIGSYTIVEGEDDLFLYNNKTGKTYKFVLQEVDRSIVPDKMRTD